MKDEKYFEKFGVLIRNLQKSKKVNAYNSTQEREADTIAHALLDMELSFNTIRESLLPKLLSATASEENVDDTFLDIGEELRHILYHIKDPKFFKYLHDTD